MINYIRQYKSFDFILLLLVIVISIIGIILVGSATHINIPGANTSFYNKQKFLFIIGLILLVVSSFIDYQLICKFYIFIYVINVLFLLFVLLFTKDDGTGTSRWIGVGSFGIQPSEFAKIFMILFIAKVVDIHKDSINTFKTLAIISILIIMPVGMVYVQPSLSASIVVLVICLGILYIGGIDYRYIIIGAVVGGSLIAAIYSDANLEHPIFADKFLTDYQISRIRGTNMDQTNYSIQAIASGHLSGKGLYHGTVNQLNYLAYSQNDFIFAVLSEEFGFFGAITVLGLILLIVLKCIITAFKASTFLGKLIATGVGTMIGFQAFFHVGVGIGMLPNTGVPFPFLSSGGSSMWINMIGIGLVINVGMSQRKSIFEE